LERFWNGTRTTSSERAPATFANGPLSLDPFQSALPSLRITKRRLKRVEAIRLVREQRDNRSQEVSYNARPFVLCGLPLRRPPADQLVYTRRNGSFVLEITAHPRFGLPYGQDRLVPIWMATLALKQRIRTVHFMSPTQLLDYFHLPKDGAQYRRVRAALQRIFAATIFFGTEQETKKQTVVESARFHFMDSMRLWFSRSEEPESAGNDASDNTITLSEAFHQEISAHPIPVEREVIAALAHAPGLLDFYVWITWKSWTVNGQAARIPILGPTGLGNQLGSVQYSVDRLFRHKILHWLRHVRLLWPQCPAKVSQDGCFLVVHSSRQSAALHSAESNKRRRCPAAQCF
jgi:Plasmid encoded RepA protein